MYIKVEFKDTRTTSLTFYFTHFCISIVDFKKANAGRVQFLLLTLNRYLLIWITKSNKLNTNIFRWIFSHEHFTDQKLKNSWSVIFLGMVCIASFSLRIPFTKCEQICSFLWFWSHLLK